MSPIALTTVAMSTAGIMLAHQVASKAFRDAAFLSAWPATALPVMTLATAALVLALVPLFSRLLARFSPLAIVTLGFGLSAAGHVLEWVSFGSGRWMAVVIYLHLAGVSALLLSGFWSLIAERFDPAAARATYGRIAAAGTFGGVVGSIAADRVATMASLDSVLLMLAGLHVACALGLVAMRQAPVLLPHQAEGQGHPSTTRELLHTPYVRTMASLVILTTAGSAMLDYLLKSHATASLGTGPGLLRFFAVYYGTVQVLSFFAQAGSGDVLKRLGIGGSIRTLPAGVGAAGALALVFQNWPFIAMLRATEAVLRGSLFRSAYELLFVPMDPTERRRVKTILDVTCDRAGEAAGAGIVQLLLFTGLASLTASLLALVLVVELTAFWLGRRLDPLYLGVVEAQLLRHRDPQPVSLVSEAGWSILRFPTPAAGKPPAAASPAPASAAGSGPAARADGKLDLLADLRSGDATRVAAALAPLHTFDRIHVAQIIDLLAWDDVLASRAHRARTAGDLAQRDADRCAARAVDGLRHPPPSAAHPGHVPHTSRTRRRGQGSRRLPLRGAVSLQPRHRSDPRARAVPARRPRAHHRGHRARALGAAAGVARLSAPRPSGRRWWRRRTGSSGSDVEKPRTHLRAALDDRRPRGARRRGARHPFGEPGVRGLAIEYLDQVLPAAVLERLRDLMAATPSASGAPSQSGSPPTTTPPSAPR